MKHFVLMTALLPLLDQKQFFSRNNGGRGSWEVQCRGGVNGALWAQQQSSLAQPNVSIHINPTCSSHWGSYGPFAEELSWFICPSSAKRQHWKSKRQVQTARIQAGSQRQAVESDMLWSWQTHSPCRQVFNMSETDLNLLPKSRLWQPCRIHQIHNQEPLSSHLLNTVDGPKRDHTSKCVGGKGLGMNAPKIT